MASYDKVLEQLKANQEMLRRQAFERAGFNHLLKVTNWTAPTTIGRFDASYDPVLGEYTITVKCWFNFIDPPLGQVSHDQVPWDEKSKQAYIQATQQVAQQHWSDRYLLKCTRPGWQHYRAKVQLCVVAHPEKQSAHYELKARRLPDNVSSEGGGVEWSRNPPMMKVDSKGVTPKRVQKQQKAIFEMRERLLKDTIRAHNVRVIGFGSSSSTVDVADRNRLIRFANQIKRFIADDVVGIRLYVYGSTSGFDVHSRASKRATAVANIIKGQLGPHADCVHTLTSLTKGKKAEALKQIRDHNNDQTITSTSLAGAVIFVHTPHDVTREAIMNYIVMVHEFGHVLGLPDEYLGSHHPQLTAKLTLNSIIPGTLARDLQLTVREPKDRIKSQQLGMVQMQEAVGDTIDLPFFVAGTVGQSTNQAKQDLQSAKADWYVQRDQKLKELGGGSKSYKRWIRNNQPPTMTAPRLGSSSIMFSGMDIMPAHYLTIWSSLCEATSEFLSPDEWTIIESPRNPDGARWFNT